MSNQPRSILVPLDGSDLAERAVTTAVSLFPGGGKGTLHLLSAVSPLPLFRPADPMSGESKGWFAEEGVRTRNYLEGVRDRVHSGTPEVEIQLHVPTGRPAAAILAAVKSVGPDLLVMTPGGRGRLMRAWVGSVADRVMREASCPVLLLTGEGDAFDPTSILVAIDGSPVAERALEEAAKLARRVDGRLTLACVIARPQSVAVPYLDLSAEAERMRLDREAAMRETLEALAAPLRAEGLRVDVLTSRADETAPGLLRLREQARAGLVAMGTQGRGAVERMILGSVATRIVRGSPVPVLLTPPASAP